VHGRYLGLIRLVGPVIIQDICPITTPAAVQNLIISDRIVFLSNRLTAVSRSTAQGGRSSLRRWRGIPKVSR
jgi:hypothetical protein